MGMTISYVSFHQAHLETVNACNLKRNVQVIRDRCYIFGDEKFDSDKTARRISKKAGIAALSFFYFDDESLVMRLFAEGKVVAQHCNTPSYLTTSKPDNFAMEFGLNDSDRKLLKRICKVESLETQITYLEGVLKTPLLVDEQAYNENPDEYLREHPLMSADAIRAELKAAKIKNRKNAVCIFETPVCRMNSYRTHPYFVLQIKDTFAFFKLTEENEALPLWQMQDSQIYEIKRFRKTDNGYVYNYDTYSNTVVFTDEGGRVRGRVAFSSDVGVLSVSDDEKIYARALYSLFERDRPNKAMIYDNQGTPLFSQLHASFSSLHPFLLTQDAVIKINGNGEEVGRYEKDTRVFSATCGGKAEYSEEHLHVTDESKVWYYFQLYQNGTHQSYLQLLDENLQVHETIRVADRYVGIMDNILEDKANNRVLLQALDKVIPIDVDAKTVKKPVVLRDSYVLHVDREGYIYSRKGRSTLEVYTSDFELVSVHKLKGYILQYFGDDKDGNPRFLTVKTSYVFDRSQNSYDFAEAFQFYCVCDAETSADSDPARAQANR